MGLWDLDMGFSSTISMDVLFSSERARVCVVWVGEECGVECE
jgi:hypothetical protein